MPGACRRTVLHVRFVRRAPLVSSGRHARGGGLLKLLLFSDLHLDAQFSWLGTSAQAARERRQALRQTLLNISTLARSVDAGALLCGGDLYEHERISPDTAAFLRTTFADLDPLPVYIAPGNHDWYGPTGAYAQVNWSPNVHVFKG